MPAQLYVVLPSGAHAPDTSTSTQGEYAEHRDPSTQHSALAVPQPLPAALLGWAVGLGVGQSRGCRMELSPFCSALEDGTSKAAGWYLGSDIAASRAVLL